jgi:hypothetical protein
MSSFNQKKNPPFEVNINFDEASSVWRQNKKLQRSGTFTYVCGTQLKNGSYCQNPVYQNINCHLHK